MMVVAVLLGGCFLVMLPWAPAFRFKLAAFFAEREDLFLPIGVVILSLGFLLLVVFYEPNRRRFFQVNMKASASPADIQEELLLTHLSLYWKKLFPKESLMTDVFIHRNQKIELIAEIPPLAEQERKLVLEKVEKEMGALLATQLGYQREFLFTWVIK